MPRELSAKIFLEATVAPSEDPAKVLAAVEAVIGTATHSVSGGAHLIQVESRGPEGLDRLHDQLRDRQVRAAARRRFAAGRSGDKTTVMVNRQAAAAGVVVLCDSEEESPLGPIFLTIESGKLDDVIQWLTEFQVG